jgi:hypothetical protein
MQRIGDRAEATRLFACLAANLDEIEAVAQRGGFDLNFRCEGSTITYQMKIDQSRASMRKAASYLQYGDTHRASQALGDFACCLTEKTGICRGFGDMRYPDEILSHMVPLLPGECSFSLKLSDVPSPPSYRIYDDRLVRVRGSLTAIEKGGRTRSGYVLVAELCDRINDAGFPSVIATDEFGDVSNDRYGLLACVIYAPRMAALSVEYVVGKAFGGKLLHQMPHGPLTARQIPFWQATTTNIDETGRMHYLLSAKIGDYFVVFFSPDIWTAEAKQAAGQYLERLIS